MKFQTKPKRWKTQTQKKQKQLFQLQYYHLDATV